MRVGFAGGDRYIATSVVLHLMRRFLRKKRKAEWYRGNIAVPAFSLFGKCGFFVFLLILKKYIRGIRNERKT